MDDDVRRKQNEIIIGIYTTPVEDLLISCCEGLREIIPFDHSYTALTINPIDSRRLSIIKVWTLTKNHGSLRGLLSHH